MVEYILISFNKYSAIVKTLRMYLLRLL